MPGFRPRFFIAREAAGTPDDALELCGAELPLDAEDSYHAAKVLRLRQGDECEVVVGAAVYAATVCVPEHPVRVRLVRGLAGADAGAAYRVRVGVVQALGRPAAMEYVLEKATEVGASFFIFVPSAGSPKRSDAVIGDRLTRWRRIVREAAKQSKQSVLPELEVVASLDEAVHMAAAGGDLSLVLEPGASSALSQTLAAGSASHSRVALWIGPEGGWTSAETERFAAAGIAAVRLGRSVLRTETAGPVAVAVARLALGDW